MIVPSIDIRGGRAVQLVGGREQALDAGDPRDAAERFAVAGQLAVIDLDAAFGQGDNRAIIEKLVASYPCRVGGGIRSVEAAQAWLDAGAEAVILGTAATPDILAELPPERVIAALDARDGEVVVDGWRQRSGATIDARLAELCPLVSAFLITFVEREGRLAGTDLARARDLVELAAGCRITFAGGITTADEIAELDRLGADAQVGMALYTDALPLAAAVAAPLCSDRADGLWPTVVCDTQGVALGLAYSDRESLTQAIETRRGVYRSRSRGLWVKGESSGDWQRLLRVDLDCDRDALRFVVEQHGRGFCHLGTYSCWPSDSGLGALERRLQGRLQEKTSGSYTLRLARDPSLLADKLQEEARELATADSPRAVQWEAADLIYFTMAAMASRGVSLAEVQRELDRRRTRVRRRSATEESQS